MAAALRVLIAPDKFKGTLTARQAAAAIARGWRSMRSQDTLTLLPISDGGDGFGEVMSTLMGAKRQSIKTVDAAHRECIASWWWDARSGTALIESAEIIGLARLPRGKYHPFQLDTFGLGAVVQAAIRKGARRILIGVGGSATNDGGFGLARAVGWKFKDRAGNPILSWTKLHSLAEIHRPREHRSNEVTVAVAVDVQNRLLGARGATRVFGPQKGLRKDEFARAEANLRRLSRVLSDTVRPRGGISRSGDGAAGGLGFGLRLFLGARLEPGFELFARCARMNEILRRTDLIITGEGSVDESTFMGKGVGELVRRGRERKIPCIALAGVVALETRRWFSNSRGLNEITSTTQAHSKPAQWLERLAQRVSRVASFSPRQMG